MGKWMTSDNLLHALICCTMYLRVDDILRFTSYTKLRLINGIGATTSLRLRYTSTVSD